MILVQCGECGKRYQVPDAYAGKKMRCKQCSGVLAIPPAPPPNLELEPGPGAGPELEAGARPAAAKPAGPPGRKPLKLPPRKPLGGAKKPGFAPRPPGLTKPQPFAKRPAAARAVQKDEMTEDFVVEAAAPGGAPPDSNRKKVLGLAAVVVLLLAAGGGAYYFFIGASEGGSATGPGAKTKTAKKVEEKAKEGEDAKTPLAGVAKGGETGDTRTKDGPAAAEEIEKIHEPLKIIPKDVEFVAKVDYPQLVNFVGMEEQIEQALQENREAFQEAGFDPKGHLRTVWFFGKLPSQEASLESVVALLEGTFDKEKLIPALKKAKKISQRPKTVGRLEVYDLLEADGQLGGHGCLLSYEQALVGTGDVFNAALKLVEGGDSVAANADLKEISEDFSARGLLWAATRVTPEALAGLQQALGQPPPEINGLLFTFDRSADDGVAIEAKLHCRSPEEARKAQGFIGSLIGMGKIQMPSALKPILDKPKLAAEGKVLKISLDLSAADLDQLKGMAAMMAGGPGDPGAAPSGTEAEEETGEEAPAEETAEEAAAEEEPAKEKAAEEPVEPEEPKEEPPAKKAPGKKPKGGKK